MAKLVLEAINSNSSLPVGILQSIAQFNFLYYSGVLLAISILLVVGISLVTPKTPDAQMAGITFATLSEADKQDIRNSWDKWDLILTGVVLGLVVGIYLYFSFWLS
jgi:SSS family solute:Na+ symporter